MNTQLLIRPLSTIDDRPDQVVTVSYLGGKQPVERPALPANNSAVLLMLVTIMLAIAVVMRHSRRYFKSAVQSIITVRMRENAFDEHTINEDAIVVTLNVAAAFSMATILYTSIGTSSATTSYMQMLALTSGFIVAQYAMYALIGYTFASRNMASQWIQGFNATQCYVGIGLMFPAAAIMFYPGAYAAIGIIAACIYAVSHILFICKGFRIFFDNIFSLVYFILYLCSSEIIPVLLVYRKAVELCC